MEATLITIHFDPERKIFPPETLEDFCINKKVLNIESHFFQLADLPYWTILISFERLSQASTKLPSLTKEEHALYERLRIWRKEKSEKEGFPAYLVATNRQLGEIIQRRVRSKAGFSGIKGFGLKRIQKYGEEIIHLIKQFFEYE